MSTLSNVDIQKELGENILIYPFTKTNLKGASYNLTASEIAWSLSSKNLIYNQTNNSINIDPGDTALIETKETIWVSKKICGTYHSRVGQVSHGTGHIGTNLDPNYIGPSLIAVHNHTKATYSIEVGKPFISLMFHYLLTDSSIPDHGNSAGRTDILAEVGIKPGGKLDEPYMSNKELLKSKLEECPDYQTIKIERNAEAKKIKQQQDNRDKKHFSYRLYGLIIGAILLLLSSSWLLQTNQKQLNEQSWYVPTTGIINQVVTILSSALTALITVDMTRRK